VYLLLNAVQAILYFFSKNNNFQGFRPFLSIIFISGFLLLKPAFSQEVNIAIGKTATASSEQNDADGHFTAGNAVDGNAESRWGSHFSDPQWIQVDLGAVHSLNSIILRWEDAAARDYLVQISTNNSTWITVETVSEAAQGHTRTINLTSQDARYVKIACTARATEWGYSLFELEVLAADKPDTTGTGITDTSGSIIVGDRPNQILGMPFKYIRIGDMDGNGFGDGTGYQGADGGPVNVDGTGILYGGDYLPSLNGTGSVATGSGDDYDNRDPSEQSDARFFSQGAVIGTGMNGSDFTDISLADSYDGSNTAKTVWNHNTQTYGGGGEKPGNENTTSPKQPRFIFDFAVEEGMVASGTDIYFNMVFGDYDVGDAIINVTFHNGSMISLPISKQNEVGGGDGLIQTAFSVLSFDNIFYSKSANGYLVGFLQVDFVAASEPYTTFDFVELSVTPIDPDIVVIPGPAVLEVQKTVMIAGDTAALTAHIFDNELLPLSDYPGIITWQVDPHTMAGGDTLLGTTGETVSFTAIRAHRIVNLDVIYTDPSDTSILITTKAIVEIIPAAPWGVDIQPDSNSTSLNEYHPDIAMTLEPARQTVLIYASVRDVFGNFIRAANQALWTSTDESIITVSGSAVKMNEGTIVKIDSGLARVRVVETGLHSDSAAVSAVIEPVPISSALKLYPEAGIPGIGTNQPFPALDTMLMGTQLTLYAHVTDAAGTLLGQFDAHIMWSGNTSLTNSTGTSGTIISPTTPYSHIQIVVSFIEPGFPSHILKDTLTVYVHEDPILDSVYILDSDEDGTADILTLYFDRNLTSIPEIITSIDWPAEGVNNYTATPGEMAFTNRPDGAIDSSIITIILSENKPFEPGVTGASIDNPPSLDYMGISVPILDRISPSTASSVKNPSDFSRYGIRHSTDSVEIHIQPDTLYITLTEPVDGNGSRDMFLSVLEDGSTVVIPMIADPITHDGGKTWTVLIDNTPGSPTVMADDVISLNPYSGINDMAGNSAFQLESMIDGRDGKQSGVSDAFREQVTSNIMDGDLNPDVSLIDISIPVYDTDGNLLTEMYNTAIALKDTWVPPAQMDASGNINHNLPCSDSRFETEFPRGYLASLAIRTEETDGPYTATVEIWDHLGNFIRSWKQRFGYCGEMENPARRDISGIPGVFVSDLIWNQRNKEGKLVGNGVYIWKYEIVFENGEIRRRTRKMGVARNSAMDIGLSLAE